MSEEISKSTLNALKIAFTYMPNPIEVTKYEYGDTYQKVLDQIQTVRETLLLIMKTTDVTFRGQHRYLREGRYY